MKAHSTDSSPHNWVRVETDLSTPTCTQQVVGVFPLAELRHLLSLREEGDVFPFPSRRAMSDGML